MGSTGRLDRVRDAARPQGLIAGGASPAGATEAVPGSPPVGALRRVLIDDEQWNCRFAGATEELVDCPGWQALAALTGEAALADRRLLVSVLPGKIAAAQTVTITVEGVGELTNPSA